MDSTLKNILAGICSRYGYTVKALEVMPDHVHIFVDCPQTVTPCDIARTLKSISAIELFRAYPQLNNFMPAPEASGLPDILSLRLGISVKQLSKSILRSKSMARKKHVKTEYEKSLQRFRKSAARHVLILEADMPEDMKRRAFGLSDQIRICGNQLTARLSKAMEQLFRTKAYRGLQKDYGELSERLKRNPDDKDAVAALKQVSSKMSSMQKAYRVTWDDARLYMIYLKEKAGLNSVFALSRAEDIWSGAEKVLFGTAKKIHFKRRGEFPEIRAKQINRGIILYVKDNRLYFKCSELGSEKFTVKEPDKFQRDEIDRVLSYLAGPEIKDALAVNTMLESGKTTDTFRPCYASLVCKETRGKLRVYIHLTIEGKAAPKFKSDGVTPRHSYGKGRVGADIGTQTVAYTSDREVGLKNLSERGMSISHAERQERRLLRKMDRSRRAMNPDNYNAEGTIKKGRKKWVKSNRYKKLQKRHADLCRKNADNRRYAINEDVNHIRSLGDELVAEAPNFKALQKRAKPKEAKQEGVAVSPKRQRRKRFGKSLRNRCPGAFQAALKAKFELTGGSYHEVDKMFRASQYDHTSDSYVKKKLSQRMFTLEQGERVQRDWYSSFLLYNADTDYAAPDRDACSRTFNRLYAAHLEMIENIKRAGVRVLNSGI